MPDFKGLFKNAEDEKDYDKKAQLLSYYLNVFRTEASRPKTPADKQIVKEYILGELKNLLPAIDNAPDYKTKDAIFAVDDKLLGLMAIIFNPNEFSEEDFKIVTSVIEKVKKETVLESTLDEAFEKQKIEQSDIEALIKVARSVSDEYQKGKLYQGFLYHKDSLNKLSPEAKNVFAEYIAEELKRYLNLSEYNDEIVNVLEIIADIAKYFANDSLLSLVSKLLELNYNNIRYYAIETLISKKVKFNATVIEQLAKDLKYAELTYSLLQKYNLTNLFPAEYSSPEYLAKSDMVHWLNYPTELGETPNKIELLGELQVKKDKYYIFKFKSDSDNLSDDLKGLWLIGWSSPSSGNTFSDFDKLADYEKKNLKKTLKNIRKQLL